MVAKKEEVARRGGQGRRRWSASRAAATCVRGRSGDSKRRGGGYLGSGDDHREDSQYERKAHGRSGVMIWSQGIRAVALAGSRCIPGSKALDQE